MTATETAPAIDCEHLRAGLCVVASDLAGVDVDAHNGNCQACLASDAPRAANVSTIGLARVALRKLGLPADDLYPAKVRAALDAGGAPAPPRADGYGRAFLAFVPWAGEQKTACDCSSFLSILDRWGPTKAIEQKDRVVRWFLGIAKQLNAPTTAAELELALFRAADAFQRRDEAAAALWPFVFTYYGAGAVGDELKYSIRSVLRWQPSARVIVIGDKPAWYAGEFIHAPRIKARPYHAFRDCYSKLLRAAELLPRFIWHMDDIYWIKPFTIDEAAAPKYVRHVSQARFKTWKPRNSWGKTRAHAYRYLLDLNRPTYDFAAHLPQPIESAKFLATEAEAQLMTGRYRNWECVYLNSHHAATAEDWGRRYLRVTRKRDEIATRHKLLNHTHAHFRGAVETYLAQLLPDPSPLEAAQ
jgi:hypothetical protein